MPALIRQSQLVVKENDDGKTLIDFLCSRFTYHDCPRWLAELNAARLLLNGVAAEAHAVLKQGDTLEYLPVPRPEPPVDFGTAVLAVHGDYIFLNKSGNIPCHPAGCFFNHTVWAQLKCGEIHGLPPMPDVHFVSRLDRETSGVILVARTAHAARAAELALAQRDAFKEYRVLVEGKFPDALDAEGYLWNAQDAIVEKRRRFSVTPPPGTVRKLESSRTIFRCIRQFDGMSEVSAMLVTGRMHQIRATLSSLGFPVVGDKVYGVDETIFLRFIANAMTADDEARLRMARQALHAHHLHMTLPGETHAVDILAPTPFGIGENR